MLSLGLAAAALALTGCSITGEVVLDRDATHLDLRLSHPLQPGMDSPCEEASGGPTFISVSERSVDDGVVSCRLTGSLPRGGDVDRAFITRSNNHLFLAIPPDYFGAVEPASVVDITAVFVGGTVVASSEGEVGADRVRWRDLSALQNDGMAATARVGPDASWIMPAALGLGAGASFVGLVRALALGLVGLRDEPPDLQRVRRRPRWAGFIAASLPLPDEPAVRTDLPERTRDRPLRARDEDPEAWAPDRR